MKLAAPPKEFKTLVRWLNSHADALMTSRLMFAAWPSRPNLPQALFVIEFPSPEEAQKFEPQLKAVSAKISATPAPESSPGSSPGKNEPSEVKPRMPPPPPSYILKQSGPLVFISDSQFTFKALRPTGSKLLSEDPNFRQVHDRFSSESVFSISMWPLRKKSSRSECSRCRKRRRNGKRERPPIRRRPRLRRVAQTKSDA